jgi:hypothetical protein
LGKARKDWSLFGSGEKDSTAVEGRRPRALGSARVNCSPAGAVLPHGHRLPSLPPVRCARPEGLAELESLGYTMRNMPEFKPTGLLLIILCLSCTGCVQFSSQAGRDASFSPYKNAKVGQESLGDYLVARSAVVLTGEKLSVGLNTNSSGFYYSNAWRAVAAAIDSRGYFLTVAHCPLKGQVWLAFPQEGRMQLKQARIIWRGDEKKGEPDLALLCVSSPISRTFQWATELTNGSPVVNVGSSKDDRSGALKPQFMGGKLLKLSEASSKGSLNYTEVSHSSPIRPGDSGGPLVLSDGGLLGINASGYFTFQWGALSREREYSTAHRPDLVWLRKVIDTDAALFPSETSSP